ncbi:hypothetical protein CYLTODRAFT_460333, partial [Cylindrobasidium torrendii FP15055 ss-10]
MSPCLPTDFPAPAEFIQQHEADIIPDLVDVFEKLDIESSPMHFYGKTSGPSFIHQFSESSHGSERAERKAIWTAPPASAVRPCSRRLTSKWWEAQLQNTAARRYQFPEPELMASLIDLYFVCRNLFIPLLHRPSFESSVAQAQGLHLHDHGFASVVLLVCAIASRNSDDPRVLLENDITRRQSAGWMPVMGRLETILFVGQMTPHNTSKNIALREASNVSEALKQINACVDVESVRIDEELSALAGTLEQFGSDAANLDDAKNIWENYAKHQYMHQYVTGSAVAWAALCLCHQGMLNNAPAGLRPTHKQIKKMIDSLPDELLVLIFDMMEDYHVVPWSSRMRIATVARQWRQLANSTPWLWTRMDIVLYDYDYDYDHDWATLSKPVKYALRCIDTFRLHVARTGLLPLQVTVIYLNDDFTVIST